MMSEIIKTIEQYFSASVFVDVNDLTMKIFLTEEEQGAENLMILDRIEFMDAMKVFNTAY